MNKLRKYGLRISFATLTLGIIVWLAGFFSGTNYENFQAFAIYLLVASVFFASPHMIITHDKKTQKTRLETYADLGVSAFYSSALIFVFYNAIPYFSTDTTSNALQITGQAVLVVSFLWTLCIHCWSTIINLTRTFKPI